MPLAQDADGLASGLVSGDVTGAVVWSGAVDVDGLELDEEQAPTANVAARISRASKDLTMASSCGGIHQR